MPQRSQKPKTKKHYKQKPVPGTNRLIDLVKPALPPGWRISERTGKPYFENRENRSDTAAEIAVFVPKPKKPKTANPKKKTTAKQTTAKAKKPAAPKKTTAPMAVIYGPYLTGSTGYALKKGTGQWEGYWCIRRGWRKNNKSPFVWSSSEAVTMGHIPMDRGETAALQYLAEVAKRKGWKQMYPKKPAAQKKKPTAEPKTASPEKKAAAPKKPAKPTCISVYNAIDKTTELLPTEDDFGYALDKACRFAGYTDKAYFLKGHCVDAMAEGKRDTIGPYTFIPPAVAKPKKAAQKKQHKT